jgi:2-polyprenyl-3-methyl-5-hydroxy-6-metoxy-1,4-benzoquinol methylase
MKLGLIPESDIERDALESGRVPRPMIESYFSFMLSRTLMVATKLGVFDALEAGPLDASSVATKCSSEARATEKLLRALTGCAYLSQEGNQYELTPMARKWLVESSRDSYRDKLLFQFMEWSWWEGCERFVKTGEPLRIHESMDADGWKLYQRGMRAGKDAGARELAQRLPLPADARSMLDIGGAHGLYSVAICREHANLTAIILDLPEAIEHAAPLLAREGMGERVVHLAGDALRDDLGSERYDLVFIASLVHHFDDPTNRELVKRSARALRPGGVLAIVELVRLQAAKGVSQFGGLMDLYFAMTSQSGTWSAEEIAEWQRDAGLSPSEPIRLSFAENVVLQVATKSG